MDIASLRFESAGMKAIVDKTKNGSASSDDFVRLSELLTSSVDDVTKIFAQLAYDRNYGKYLLVHSGLDVAGQFDDKVKALKTEIRQRLGKLREMDPRKKEALLEAGKISKLIDDFNTDLVRLHGIAFGPRKASQSKPKAKAKAKATKAGRKQTTTSGKK